MAAVSGDTIVALSSGAVPAGIAVIRLSGSRTSDIVAQMLGSLPAPRRLTLAPIALDNTVLDTGLVAWMPGPASFTGEDCAELQLHGSPAVVRSVLRHLTGRPGIRLAEPGEFTRRAFENGKLDLTEAQGLGDLIIAETENQRALAYARMEGGLTRQVETWRERLLDLRALIEAQLDFSDEDDVDALPPKFLDDVEALRRDIGTALASRGHGRVLRNGFRVVLAGSPNAGKSSLLNALSRSDVAIVSDEAGTTRDLKEVPLDIKGQLVILIDSAGIRSASSKAEAIGVERARQAMETADLVLWLTAPDVPMGDLPSPASEGPGIVLVSSKSDLGRLSDADLSVSAHTGEGVDQLLELLYEKSGAGGVDIGSVLVSHERDRQALASAVDDLADFGALLPHPEVAAESLRRVSASLARLLGKMDAEHVLDSLFSRFCIGK